MAQPVKITFGKSMEALYDKFVSKNKGAEGLSRIRTAAEVADSAFSPRSTDLPTLDEAVLKGRGECVEVSLAACLLLNKRGSSKFGRKFSVESGEILSNKRRSKFHGHSWAGCG